MSIRALRSLVLALTVLTILPTAWAELPHQCGRRAGIGWSDGYHSHAACPPQAPLIMHTQVAAAKPVALPWWKIPTVGASSSANSASFRPTSGPSLFRQPGEGTSINAPTLAQP